MTVPRPRRSPWRTDSGPCGVQLTREWPAADMKRRVTVAGGSVVPGLGVSVQYSKAQSPPRTWAMKILTIIATG